MKEKDLKVWLQQVGRGEACNCFCSPRSLAEHRAPGAVCPASRSSLPPGTRGLRARARLCSAPTPGRGSAAGPPRARVGATAAAAATGQGLTQGEREKPSLHCCAAQGRTHLQTWVRWPPGWGYPVLYCLPPDWHEQWLTMKRLGCFLSQSLTRFLLLWVGFFDLNELCLDIYCTFSFPYLPKEGTQIF